MFKITTTGKVQKLLDYYNRVVNNQWVLLGNTSPWLNESLPPDPSSEITYLLEPISFFRVLDYKPVYISSDGDIQTSNATYQSVNSFNKTTLIDLKVSSLLITVVIPNSSLGNIIYRSAALCNNLPSSTLNVLPYDSTLSYDLEGVVYFTPQSTSNILQSNVIRFVMNF